MAYTYILRSLRDGKFYYGSTGNLLRRLKDHNMGKVRSTKGRRPLELHYSEEFTVKSDALRREMFFKSIDGRRWLQDKGII